jgi:hypothetical protein
MIFECGPDGADHQVCRHLARFLQPDIEIAHVTLDNKPKLIAECGSTAVRLLAEGCERIVIVWDLHPPWRSNRQKPCRREDREAILSSLTRAGVKSSSVFLVCIEEELEAWLLADGRALAKVMSRPTRPVKIRDIKNSEQTRKPKTLLNQMFQQNSGRPYVDRIHARLIVEALPDLSRMKRCATFVRFSEKVTGKKP